MERRGPRTAQGNIKGYRELSDYWVLGAGWGSSRSMQNYLSPLQPANSHPLRHSHPQIQSHIYVLTCGPHRLHTPAHPARGLPGSPLLLFLPGPQPSQTLGLILSLPQIRGAAPLCASKCPRRKPWKAAGLPGS